MPRGCASLPRSSREVPPTAHPAHAPTPRAPLPRRSHSLLERAAASDCWADSLEVEATLCAAALGTADSAAGLQRLGELKSELAREGEALAEADGFGEAALAADPAEAGAAGEEGEEGTVAWEHAAAGEIDDATVARYFQQRAA